MKYEMPSADRCVVVVVGRTRLHWPIGILRTERNDVRGCVCLSISPKLFSVFTFYFTVFYMYTSSYLISDECIIRTLHVSSKS